MTQKFNIGELVLYGIGAGPDFLPFHDEAMIIGLTQFDDGYYYVLKSNETEAFIRPESWMSRNTSLDQYIGDYINEEMHRHTSDVFDIHLPSNRIRTQQWIREAIDAYEGGAR